MDATRSAVRWIQIGDRLCRKQGALQRLGRRDVGLGGALPNGHADAGTCDRRHVVCGHLSVLHQAVDPRPGSNDDVSSFAILCTLYEAPPVENVIASLCPVVRSY